MFFDRAFLYNLFQTKPTRRTPLLSTFISTSLHVSGNCVPIIRRTYCIYATLSANLYDIYHCCVYSEKLLMMDRGTVRKMQSFIPKINLRN